MSDYRGNIKHAVHVSCKSQIHTSCVASAAGVGRVPQVHLTCLPAQQPFLPNRSSSPIDQTIRFSIGQFGHHTKPSLTGTLFKHIGQDHLFSPLSSPQRTYLRCESVCMKTERKMSPAGTAELQTCPN